MLQTLKWLFSNLTHHSEEFCIKDSFINIHSKFPNIKLTLNQQKNNRKIDIVAFQKHNNSRKYVNFMLRAIDVYPYIQTFFYLIHKLLKSFQLHTPALNGLKTYSIFLVIYQFVEHYHASSIIDLFFSFVNYYANSMVYRE